MPAFQVLEPAPSFSGQLGAALGGGLSQGLGSALSQHLEQKKIKNIISSLGLSTSGTPLDAKSLVKGTEKTGVPPIPAKQQPMQIKPEHLVAANFMDPSGKLSQTLGTIYSTQQQASEKRALADMERSNKYYDTVRAETTKVPEREVAITSAINAINQGVGKISDWFADVFNLPGLRGAPAAQLNTAAKQNLMGSLTSLPGARPNQYIEQQINNAFARAGQSKEANLSQMEMIKAVFDMDKNRLKMAREIEQQYANAGVPLPGNVEGIVLDSTAQYNENRMKELAYDLQVLNEKDLGPDKLQKLSEVSNGTPLTVEKAKILLQKSGAKDIENPTPEEEQKAMKMAIRLGYEIPSPEIYGRRK